MGYSLEKGLKSTKTEPNLHTKNLVSSVTWQHPTSPSVTHVTE